MHFYKLTRWGIDPASATQMAAILQTFLQQTLEPKLVAAARSQTTEPMILQLLNRDEEPPTEARVNG